MKGLLKQFNIETLWQETFVDFKRKHPHFLRFSQIVHLAKKVFFGCTSLQNLPDHSMMIISSYSSHLVKIHAFYCCATALCGKRFVSISLLCHKQHNECFHSIRNARVPCRQARSGGWIWNGAVKENHQRFHIYWRSTYRHGLQ